MERHSSDDTKHDTRTKAILSVQKNHRQFHKWAALNHSIDSAPLRIPYHRIRRLCANIIQRMHFYANTGRKHRHSIEKSKIPIQINFRAKTALTTNLK